MNEQLQPVFTVQGLWYDGVTSRARTATLRLRGSRADLEAEGTRQWEAELSELQISPRLGSTPRYITFANSGRFETHDNRQLDQWLEQQRRTPWNQLVHRLETRWQWVLVSLLLVIAFVWGMVRFALPLAAYELARLLPPQLEQKLGAETLAVLDEHYLRPSQLPGSEQSHLREQAEPLLRAYPQLPLKLLFRDGGAVGANAFALPDGTLIVTDQMVALAATSDELLAVLAHETGHVAYRHSLQALVRSSLLGFAVMFVVGDVTATSELLLGAPVVLLELSFSRGFEREADGFALQYLQNHHIDPANFVRLMERMEASAVCRRHPVAASAKEGEHQTVASSPPDSLNCYRELARNPTPPAVSEEQGEDNRWLNYLSTHPSTRERLERFRD